jgi:hypothetical protein
LIGKRLKRTREQIEVDDLSLIARRDSEFEQREG